MRNFQKELQDPKVRLYFRQMGVGLEKESQRVTFAGELARTDHPGDFGSRSYHPYIQTDFSETQMELITPVQHNAKDALMYLAAFHDVTLRTLEKGEMLWPFSMPPRLPVNDREIVIAQLAHFDEVLYRRYLAKAYGKRKQMVSGVHFNFEFSADFFDALRESEGNQTDLKTLRTDVYLKTSVNYLRYRWLITYLFGASPWAEEGYFTKDEEQPKQMMRSIRGSQYGYQNHPDVKVSYESIDTYTSCIISLVEDGILSEEKEFYAPVRLRGGKRAIDLKEKGVKYLEVRNLDLNPFAPYGIDEDGIGFMQLFMMLMLWLPLEDDADLLVKEGNLRNEQTAREHPHDVASFQAEGMWLLKEMETMIRHYKDCGEELALIHRVQEAIVHPKLTLAGRMIEEKDAPRKLGCSLGRKYHHAAQLKPYQLKGFEDMELSTQILLFDAIQKGIEIDVLDRQDQFLKLTVDGRTEYVKNGNMTSRDSYIVPLMMENKTVTKKVLAAAGFTVPKGKEYNQLQDGLKDYAEFAEKGFVIKPKSTNYGLGITIFKNGASQAAYEEALLIAFKEDQSVLVEEYLSGTEYRFFVLDGRTLAVMLRVPANVTGDGRHTIRELVALKNQDPLRGSGHRAPLEKIHLGEIELLMLKEQGLTAEQILPAGKTVYLRENSNISTGGDSLDKTDEMPEVYKRIAEAAAGALGAKVCGMDLIIPHLKNEEHRYGIIEANFNPAMHMHVFPHEGIGRRVTKDILNMLFEEKASR